MVDNGGLPQGPHWGRAGLGVSPTGMGGDPHAVAGLLIQRGEGPESGERIMVSLGSDENQERRRSAGLQQLFARSRLTASL